MSLNSNFSLYRPAGRQIATTALAALLLSPAVVTAGDKLMVEIPHVDAGAIEIGLRGQIVADGNDQVNGAQTWKLGAGMGISEHWFSEIYAEYEKEAEEDGYKVEFYEWENLWSLTEPGRYWTDFGIIAEYAHATDPDVKDAYKLMPLLQARTGPGELALNFGFERNKSENGTTALQFGYGWQYRWSGDRARQFALEGYGQVGDALDWNRWAQQIHQWGPAVTGKIMSAPDAGWEYRLGLYFGLNALSPAKALLAAIEYEFD